MTTDFETNKEYRAAPRRMTRERMRWYVDAQPTIAADDGHIHTQPPTIHDDVDYAKSQGLPGIIADGMISTNWIQSLMLDIFGAQCARRSRLRTKYIAPIHEDDIVIACVRIKGTDVSGGDTTSVHLDVWCEDDKGKPLTVGEATVHLQQ